MVFCINWLLSACVILKFHLFIYFLLFISGCAGSSLLPGLFSSHGDWGLFSNCSARASHHAGFSCCKAQALGWSTFALISHANKVMLKILQARFQQYVNRELPDVQAGFRRGRGTRDQIASRKTSISALLTMPKPLTVFSPVQLVAQSCPTLCNPMNCSMPGLPVHHQLPEFTQTHVHRVSDASQPSHPLSSSSPPAPNPSQHQSLFQWVNSSHQVAKVLEFQL